MQWLTLTSGRAAQEAIFYDQKFWGNQFRAWRESGRPVALGDTNAVEEAPRVAESEWAHAGAASYTDVPSTP